MGRLASPESFSAKDTVMSIMTMNAESLGKQLEAVVPDLFVVIAKNHITGMEPSTIAELLGVTTDEIQEVQQDELYKNVRLLLASEYARSAVETDFSWDAIEEQALTNLAKRVIHEKDTDTLLRIAAVANKAQRRNSPMRDRVLDPALGGARIPLTLTSRIVKRLNAKGEQEVEETRQISVSNGSAVNPSFEDIDSLLGVSKRPQVASMMKIQTREPDFAVDDMEFVSK